MRYANKDMGGGREKETQHEVIILILVIIYFAKHNVYCHSVVRLLKSRM